MLQTLDVLTMLGFVILIGTVVNNPILIVHQSLNHMREDGMSPSDAIVESVRTRIRPIFMTAVTTVLGLLPLVLFPGAGSELYRGLGAVLLGGLIVSTLLPLVLIPALFSLTMDARQWFMRLVFGRDQPLPVEDSPPKSRPPPPLAGASLTLASHEQFDGFDSRAGCMPISRLDSRRLGETRPGRNLGLSHRRRQSIIWLTGLEAGQLSALFSSSTQRWETAWISTPGSRWLSRSAVVVSLLLNLGPPDMMFLGGAAYWRLCGVLTPKEAFAGFANEGMLTVGLMFVIAAALQETGVLDLRRRPHILGASKTTRSAMARLSAVIIPISAFLNNTPVVAMFMPIVMDWCRRNQISPSKLLIPLSYIAVLGGTCTLIGTSTNLVVHGLMLQSPNERINDGMSLFEIGQVGLPYAIVGVAYLLLVGYKLLPERKELLEQLGESRREYMADMLVQPGCRLIGRTRRSRRPAQPAGTCSSSKSIATARSSRPSDRPKSSRRTIGWCLPAS